MWPIRAQSVNIVSTMPRKERRMRKSIIVALLISAALCALLAESVLAIQFKVTALDYYWNVQDINNQGAVLFTDCVMTPEGKMVELQTPEPQSSNSYKVQACSLNDSGIIAGALAHYYFDGTSYHTNYYACLWNYDGTELRRLSSGPNIFTDISNNGQLAAEYNGLWIGIGDTSLAYYVRGGSYTATFINTGSSDSRTDAVNDNGQVVGVIEDNAYVWHASTGVHSLGYGWAHDINNNGQIVGDLNLAPVLWNADYTTVNFGLTRGTALSINSQGHVVGVAYDRPFFWSPEGGLVYLPIPAGNRGTALAINDSDCIVGWTTDIFNSRQPVMWTPVPEPSSIAVLACGLSCLLGMVKRRKQN